MKGIDNRDANTRSHFQEIAREIDERLPEGWGFVLMAFPFGEREGRLNYIANCQREDGLRVIREWLAKVDAQNRGEHLP